MEIANKVIKNTVPFYTYIPYIKNKLIIAPYQLSNKPAKYISKFIYINIYKPI